MLILYAIRHSPTGFFMPVPTGRGGRGSSFWEPQEQTDYIRFFPKKLSAQRALTQWLRGTFVPDYDTEYDEYSGESYEYQIGASPTKVLTRTREEMEIVIFEVKELEDSL